MLALSQCGPSQPKSNKFTGGQDLGTIDKKIDEASGLVASIKNPGYFWTINDSGNPPEIFLIDNHAHQKVICNLSGLRNRDWEDIALGRGPKINTNYLYVADIGDNLAQYDLKYIYRFEEPSLHDGARQNIIALDTLIIKLPDEIRDTETLMIDPLTGDFFIVSKREEQVSLYQASYPFDQDTIVPAKIRIIPFTNIVAGSISPDGQEVLLKNYRTIYYWKRLPGEGIADLLIRTPEKLEYEPEHQGEAITWAIDGAGFYTLGESPSGEMAQLKFYHRNRSQESIR